MTLVSPPLLIVAVLPAETLVFVKVVSCPSLLPLPRLTEALALMLLELLELVLVWLDSFLAASKLIWLSVQFVNTIKSGAACARIHWSTGTFDRVNLSILDVLKYFEDLRRALDVLDGFLAQLLDTPDTAIMQPRDALKIRRGVWGFKRGGTNLDTQRRAKNQLA